MRYSKAEADAKTVQPARLTASCLQALPPIAPSRAIVGRSHARTASPETPPSAAPTPRHIRTIKLSLPQAHDPNPHTCSSPFPQAQIAHEFARFPPPSPRRLA